MSYSAREIKDRVALGDDIYRYERVGNDQLRLIPFPQEVLEPGTPIDKSLLQLMEDRIVWLLNMLFNDITANPFNITFGSLDGITVAGVWNATQNRIEC